MLKEFKDFLLRGNLVELAVAFVMGLAFAALIASFVGDLVLPIVAMIFGEPDFSGLDFTINDAVFRYGAFITALITFITTAAAIFFFVVKPVTAIMAQTQKPDRGGSDRRGAPASGAARGTRTALERVEADREPGGQAANLLERQHDTGDERLA